MRLVKEMKGPSIDWNNYLYDYEIFAYFHYLELPYGLVHRMIEDGRIELNGRTEKELVNDLQSWFDNTKFNQDLQPIYENKTNSFYHKLRGMVLKTIELNPEYDIKDLSLPNEYLTDKDTENTFKELKQEIERKAKLRKLDLDLNVINKEQYDRDSAIDYVILKFVEDRLKSYKKLKSESKELLLERGRKDLLNKTRNQSKKSRDRWNRRMSYKNFNIKNVDITDLIDKDRVVVTFEVADYIDTIAFTNILLNLRELVKRDPKHIIKFDWVIKACQKALDQADIYVSCTCADFKYRFAYVATKNTYKYGKKELRPADITNPDDNLGAMCKHLAAILSSKSWVNKVATRVTDWLNMLDIEEVRDALNYQEVEFPTEIARNLGKAGQAKAKSNKVQRQKEIQDNENNSEEPSEELEINDDKIEEV